MKGCGCRPVLGVNPVDEREEIEGEQASGLAGCAKRIAGGVGMRRPGAVGGAFLLRVERGSRVGWFWA